MCFLFLSLENSRCSDHRMLFGFHKTVRIWRKIRNHLFKVFIRLLSSLNFHSPWCFFIFIFLLWHREVLTPFAVKFKRVRSFQKTACSFSVLIKRKQFVLVLKEMVNVMSSHLYIVFLSIARRFLQGSAEKDTAKLSECMFLRNPLIHFFSSHSS